MFSEQRIAGTVPGKLVATLLAMLVTALLVAQPDMGNSVMILAIWFVEFFLAGLPMLWIVALAVLGLAGVITAYQMVDHVAARVNAFLDPTSADNYQINTAIDAFVNGGVVRARPGRGNGQGEPAGRAQRFHSCGCRRGAGRHRLYRHPSGCSPSSSCEASPG